MRFESPYTGHIPTHVALALLESLRDVDTPADTEGLGEMELPLNLKRRLGLSSVVGDQIRRYERRRGEQVSAAEVASLFELIGRRPDASRIFVEAGQRIARAALKRRRSSRLRLYLLPRVLRERSAIRRARRIAGMLSPGSRVSLRHRPHGIRIERGLPARAVEGGSGCAVLAGAIQYVFDDYRAGDYTVEHPACEAIDGAHCEWLLVHVDRDGSNGEAPGGEGAGGP